MEDGDLADLGSTEESLSTDNDCGMATPNRIYDSVFAENGYVSPSNYVHGRNGCDEAYFVRVTHYRHGNTDKVNQVEYATDAAAATTQTACEARRLRVYVWEQTGDKVKYVGSHSSRGTWASGACTNPATISFESDHNLPAAFNLPINRQYQFAASASDETNASDPVMQKIRFSSRTQRPAFVVTQTDATTTEDGGTGSFTVKLAKRPTASVVLSIASNTTNEGTLSTSSLTFTTANWNTAQSVTVTGANDSKVDGRVNYWVTFTNSVSTDPFFNYTAANDGIMPNPLQFANSDNEYGIVASTVKWLREGTLGVPIHYKLSRAPTHEVDVRRASSNPSDAKVPSYLPAIARFNNVTWDEWNRTRVIEGQWDQVAEDPEPTVTITASATSADANFNGKSTATNLKIYDIDQRFVVDSQSAGPFTCTTSGAQVNWNYTPDAGQNRTFSKITALTKRVSLKVLQVVSQSTYLRTMTEEDVRAETWAFSEAMVRIADGTRGQLVPTGQTIVLPRHFGRPFMSSCRDLQVDCLGETNRVHLGDYASIGKEIEKQVSLADYDYVVFMLPVSDASPSGEFYGREGVAAFAYGDGGTGTWQEGKLVVLESHGGSTNPGIYIHELAHQLEWALERGGSVQMQNPDWAFWGNAFPVTTALGGHWATQNRPRELALLWTQRGQWPAITTAAVLPKGEVELESPISKEIYTSCESATRYVEELRAR
jgi:hypothetical protein